MRLKKVSTFDPAEDILSSKTLYNWKSRGKYPELFIKFGGALLVDMDVLEALLEKHRLNRRKGRLTAERS